MATSSKKTPAKVAKKVVKTAPAPKPKAEKKPNVKFTSFTFGATIPTQPFGNVQPHITVEAGSYEDALAFAMPKIEALYAKYAENVPSVFTKVSETVKEVAPIAAPAPAPAPVAAPEPAPAPKAPEASVSSAPAPEAAPEPSESPKSEFALRAEKMIRLALTEEAAEKIKLQIESSEKIPTHEKPALLDLVQDKLIKFSAENAF